MKRVSARAEELNWQHGALIEELCCANGLTANVLARACNVTRNTILKVLALRGVHSDAYMYGLYLANKEIVLASLDQYSVHHLVGNPSSPLFVERYTERELMAFKRFALT